MQKLEYTMGLVRAKLGPVEQEIGRIHTQIEHATDVRRTALEGLGFRVEQDAHTQGKAVAMNPLKLKDTEANRVFVKAWAKTWVSTLAPGELSTQDEAGIDRLVELNYEYAAPEHQRLDLLAMGAFEPQSRVGKAVAEWHAGHAGAEKVLAQPTRGWCANAGSSGPSLSVDKTGTEDASAVAQWDPFNDGTQHLKVLKITVRPHARLAHRNSAEYQVEIKVSNDLRRVALSVASRHGEKEFEFEAKDMKQVLDRACDDLEAEVAEALAALNKVS